MRLIRKLPTRIDGSGRAISWGVFWCDPCKWEVERQLSNGKKAKSCGCTHYEVISKRNFKHGESGTKLYKVWNSMKQRILNPKCKNYKNYGGRGITLCNEWLEFIPFRDWALKNGYKEDLQINRMFNNGNYEPSNCNFVPAKENSRNRRGQKIKNMEIANEIRALYNTGNYTQKELAEKYGVFQTTISKIINNKKWRKNDESDS